MPSTCALSDRRRRKRERRIEAEIAALCGRLEQSSLDSQPRHRRYRRRHKHQFLQDVLNMGGGPSKEEQLYQAVQNGNHQLVKSFRRDGASLEWMDKEGRTPLILACTRGELFDMVITLLNLGANLNAYRPGFNGGFPLHHAAKRGLEKTVILLISRGADPLAINDDGQTPLDMARMRGHTSVVRIIEDRVCLFNGMIREVSGPGLLEVLIPQWVTKKVWAVVLPAESNPRRPPKHELVIYESPKVSIWTGGVPPFGSHQSGLCNVGKLKNASKKHMAQVAQPRTTISLSKAELEEPKWNLAANPELIITDKATKKKYKFLSETDGDKAQLDKLYKACRGIPPVVPSMGYPVPPQPGIAPGRPSEMQHPDDVALAMAIDASLQTASAEGISPRLPAEEGNANGWGEPPEEGHNGWGPPESKRPSEKKTDYGGWADGGSSSSYNGWGSPEAGPSTAAVTEAPTVPSSKADVNGSAASPVDVTGSAAAPVEERPSAPPLPEEYAPADIGPIYYPSIDTTPVSVNYSVANTDKLATPASAEGKGAEKAGSVCVVCWDAPAQAVSIPCGHLAGCMNCLEEIKKKKWGCPVCRTPIEQVVKVYTV